MKRAALLTIVVSAIALGTVTAGCNDSGVVAAPVQPSPTDTPAQPQAPVAVIDSASPVYSTMDTASFDGWLSYDPDGYIVNYQWELLAKPASSTATLTPSIDGTTSSLFIDIAGDYSIKLTVTDNDGLTGSTTYDFSATPSDFHVRLSWPQQYTEADMDLHVIDTTAVAPAPQLWDMAYDCHWRNCKPSQGENLDWGVAGTSTDNPRLDVDNISETVPENMNIQTPSDGTYRVEVHYYGSSLGSAIPVTTDIDVWLGGTLVYNTAATLTAIDQVWVVGDIVWTSGGGVMVPINSMTTTIKP